MLRINDGSFSLFTAINSHLHGEKEKEKKCKNNGNKTFFYCIWIVRAKSENKKLANILWVLWSRDEKFIFNFFLLRNKEIPLYFCWLDSYWWRMLIYFFALNSSNKIESSMITKEGFTQLNITHVCVQTHATLIEIIEFCSLKVNQKIFIYLNTK